MKIQKRTEAKPIPDFNKLLLQGEEQPRRKTQEERILDAIDKRLKEGGIQ